MATLGHERGAAVRSGGCGQVAQAGLCGSGAEQVVPWMVWEQREHGSDDLGRGFMGRRCEQGTWRRG